MRELVLSWRKAISLKIEELFGVSLAPDRVPIDFPPKPELGDATTSVAFAVAKQAGKNPAAVASELASMNLEGVSRVEAKGPYLNLFLDRRLCHALLFGGQEAAGAERGKVIVEHTNINPNKAAHIGHLRNAVLGDTFVRALRFLGRRTEVQNYIDDTGVQVADVVVGFTKILGYSLEDVRKEAAGERPFDMFCWELYARTQKWYDGNPEGLKQRYETLHLIEEGGNETALIGAFVAESMVACHLRTMKRLGITYDLLPFESDVLKSGFWRECFSLLKEKKAIEFVPPESEDKMKGCWVMRLSGNKDFEGMSDADKVIVRSNGTVTYLGKDLAYQLWKLGVLGKDFGYRPFEGGPYPITRTAPPGDGTAEGAFGRGERVYNVIDVRQSYLQKIVKEGVRLLGYEKEAEASTHFSYEMVALSTRFIRDEIARGALPPIDEAELVKPFVEMSGRKGLAYAADQLLDALVEHASKEIEKREPGLAPPERESRAGKLASAALRYYILKYSKNQVVAFDLATALSFEGETGPYIQYAGVRAENILNKAVEKGLTVPDITPGNLAELFPRLDAAGWEIVSLFLRLPFAVSKAVETTELNMIARNLYEIAAAFHNYYHKAPVLQEEDEELRNARLLFVAVFSRVYGRVLDDLCGIEIPQRM